MPTNLENSAVATGLEEVNFHFIPIPKKGNTKECSNYCAVLFISHANKVMLKILQAKLQQYRNQELPDVQVEFWKSRGTRDQIDIKAAFQEVSEHRILIKSGPGNWSLSASGTPQTMAKVMGVTSLMRFHYMRFHFSRLQRGSPRWLDKISSHVEESM